MEFTEYVREQRPALLRFATVLTGQANAAQAIRDGFATLEARHGLTR